MSAVKRKTCAKSSGGGNAKQPKVLHKFCQKYLKVPGITSSRLGDEYAHCKYCNTDFKISHGGMRDITDHSKTNAETFYRESHTVVNSGFLFQILVFSLANSGFFILRVNRSVQSSDY